MLKTTQFLVTEVGPDCNLGYTHSLCPTQRRDTSGKRLDEAKIVELAVEAYRAHHFTGLVGFHYYNEPMVSWAKMAACMEAIRSSVPESRFILWTNGTIRPEDQRIAMFEQVYCTDYFNAHDVLKEYFRHSPTVSIFPARFDNRLAKPSAAFHSASPCRRPLIECIIDTCGRMRMCCQDWRGEIEIGSIWDDTFTTLLERRMEILKRICGKEMTDDAPVRCLRCQARTGIHAFDRLIACEAEQWVNDL